MTNKELLEEIRLNRKAMEKLSNEIASLKLDLTLFKGKSLGFMAAILIFGNVITLSLKSAFIPIAVLIFITHWITDFVTSKITSKLWKDGKVHKFFVIIGLDQWLHLVQLVIIYKVFLL